jgi:hypothetical protein
MLAGFPEVKILANGGAEIQLSHVGKKVRVDFSISLVREE